ncbi:MAG: hypothetical protein HRT89_14145 [Lentisphaeria bacterium]|nr:hypothetical protein [Lentisphaeria bacterium]NQZ69197.1 hypothetical protein [Lentisphaeria bacterium]
MNDISQIKESIRASLNDLLRVHSGRQINIDPGPAIERIIDYVLKDEQITDSNRHELYYIWLGKSVAIAQGWKQNGVSEIEDVSDTLESLNSYIMQTYGK